MKKQLISILNGLTILVALCICLTMWLYEKRLGLNLDLTFDEDKPDIGIQPLKFPDLILPDYTLEKLCQNTQWRTGYYLNCTNIIPLEGNPEGTANPQGIANSYSVILTCLRWAIDAGVGFVMPRIAIRSRTDIKYFDNWEDYSYLFDVDHLRNSLSKECPQLNILNSEETNNTQSVNKGKRDMAQGPYSYGLYNQRFEKILSKAYIPKPTDQYPAVIWENEQLLLWKFCNDSQPAVYSLQKMVIPNQKLRSIASSLKNLLPPIYVGLHTRLESDMILGSYEQQIKYFLNHYQELYRNSTWPPIYISVGDRKVEDKFRREMENFNLEVMSKWTLSTKNATLAEDLNLLGFDQLALVDWNILLAAEHFFGCGSSSFSFTIAKKRGDENITDCRCHLYGEIYEVFYCSIL